MKQIHVTVFGADPRLEYLCRELIQQGYPTDYFSDVNAITDKDPTHADCLVFPMFPSMKLLSDSLKHGNTNACICAGLPSKEFILMANEHGFSVYDYMSDPHVTMQNGIATAEGALAEAIRLSPCVLQSSRVLVIGFGKCGELLAIKCRQLHAVVQVCDCHPLAQSHALAHGFSVQYPLKSCSSYDFIFNTAPYLTLDETLLSSATDTLTIIDIATAPGGTDFAYCKQAGIRAKLCPSLPAIYAPKTSGIILAHAICQRLEKLQIS